MRRLGGHTAVLLALVLALAACTGKGRVLSEEKMTRLYVDLFLADQWLKDNASERQKADTTLFFDPVFKMHQVTFEDFDASVRYYLGKPLIYTRIISDASDIMRLESERLEAIENRNREVRAMDRRNETYQRQNLSYEVFSDEMSGGEHPRAFWESSDTVKVTPLIKPVEAVVQDSSKVYAGRKELGKIEKIEIKELK